MTTTPPVPDPDTLGTYLRQLERATHRLAAVAQQLSRDADASRGITFNEPYAYEAAESAVTALMTLRELLENAHLIRPRPPTQPDQLPPGSPT